MESESCDFSFITYVLTEEKASLKDLQKTMKKVKKKLKKEKISAEWIVAVDGDLDNDKHYDVKHADHVIYNYSHQGVSISKNKALNQSSGKWLLSLDANEEPHQDFVSILLATIKEPEEIKWILFNTQLPFQYKNQKLTSSPS